MDIQRIRAETPGVEKVIHLNNCGAGLMPEPVLDAILKHLRMEAEIGGYEAEDHAEELLENTYKGLSRLLNCKVDEIAVVENATVAWDMAFYGIPLDQGDVVLTSVSEYASNCIAYLQRAQRDGIHIRVVPNDSYGQLDIKALENRIDARVKLISISHVPTSGGLINPVSEIGRVALSAGVPYLLDACQSAGQLHLDVDDIGCDMLSATGRKFLRGPRGTGFLYVRESIMESLMPPFLDLHSAVWVPPESFKMRPNARRFENWENYVAGKIGLGTAVDYALDIGMDGIEKRIKDLAENLRTRMSNMSGVAIQDLGQEKCGIISFSIKEMDPDLLVSQMSKWGINISTTSSVSTPYDMQQRNIQLMNRLGIHYYNTESEIDHFLECLQKMGK